MTVSHAESGDRHIDGHVPVGDNPIDEDIVEDAPAERERLDTLAPPADGHIDDLAPTEAVALEPADHRFGRPGPAIDRNSPFFIGFAGALGVGVAYVLMRTLVDITQVLTLVGIALFLAVGFDPLIVWMTHRGLPRFVAVVLVALLILTVIGAFVASALPPLTHEISALSHNWPKYRSDIVNGRGAIGQLAVKTHLNTYVEGKTSTTPSGATSQVSLGLVGGVVGAGKVILSAIASASVVLVLTLYFMVTLPSVRSLWLKFIPLVRRERAGAFTDEAFLRVGGFVLGNVLTSVVAGVGTTLWALALGISYPFLLGLLVAILDLIPIIGSTVGGVIVALVALGRGLPAAIATAIFYVTYRFLEDHLLNPYVMRRTVKVSAGVSIIATLIGASLLGIIGALIAIPVAATLQLVLEEVTFPTLEKRAAK